MNEVTEETKRNAIEGGWSKEQVEKGYDIFSSKDVGNGATHIERLDSVMKFDSDDEAAKYAEEHDGIKLIHDINFEPGDSNYANYVDTLENRKLLAGIIREDVESLDDVLFGNQIELAIILDEMRERTKPLGIELSDERIMEMSKQDFMDLIDYKTGIRQRKIISYHYERQKVDWREGDIVRNLNGSDYRILEKYTEHNMLFQNIKTGSFIVGIGVDFFRKMPKATEEELGRAKKLINDYCENEFGHEASFEKYPIVRLAYSEDTIGDGSGEYHSIEVSADLENFKIITEVDGEIVGVEQYKTMQDFIEYSLECLDFGSLTYLSEEELYVARGEKSFEVNRSDVSMEWGHGVYLSNIPSEIDFAALKREYGKSLEPNSKGEFDIEIREVLSRTESVKAGYLGEAIDELMDKYKKGEIVLDADDFKGVDYIPIQNKEGR